MKIPALVRSGIRVPLDAGLVLGLALGFLLGAAPARALVKFDFEQAYYTHPGMQVWDFSIVRADSLYHIFYHGIPESSPSVASADTVYHATSPDLLHWRREGAAIAVSDAEYESAAIWAPDVFFSEENGLWWMAYTGVDPDMNQIGCLAWSRDLATWYKTRLNPVLVPDSDVFFYNPNGTWNDFRDPFVYWRDGRWHMLMSARIDAGGLQGAIAHAASDDLLHWDDQYPFLINDGESPANVMESVQYHVEDGVHHVFFLEHSVDGISHIAAYDPADWSFADREFIDFGIAPEVDRFSPDGPTLLSRTAPYQEPDHPALSYVVRIDTLIYNPGLEAPTVYKPHPLLREWAVREGTSTLGNPCFGDNPARRGETPAGPVGNGYFGSKEYYQGPLSGRGAPGAFLGDSAHGHLASAPFTVTGNSMRLLVGGGEYPQTCYVALVDAATDTVIHRETGTGLETMTWRYWDLRPHAGQEVYLVIEDDESGEMGHINVDEIEELADDPPAP